MSLSSAASVIKPTRLDIRRLGIAVAVAAALAGFSAPAQAVSPWTTVTAAAPTGAGSLELLTDGSVLVGNGQQGWFKLTPDNTGKYENGTWSNVGEVASSHIARSLNPSTMLTDGRYMIAGGEFISGTDYATVDIYDPTTDTWTLGPDMPAPIRDTAASILPNGKFLVSSVSKNQEYIYDPGTNMWSPNTPTGKPLGTCFGLGVDACSGDEKGWTLLQTGKVLDTFLSFANFTNDISSVYDPSSDTWSAPLTLPAGIRLTGSDPCCGAEIGPASLLYSGKVIQFGAASPGTGPGQTAVYNPSGSGSWSAGPSAPDGLQFGDSPAAVMPNGNVLCVTSTSPEGGAGISSYLEYDPVANAFVTPAVVYPPFGGNAPTVLFLVLPTGQVLVAPTSGGISWALYMSPTGGPMSSWRPAITSISAPVNGQFTLTGTQLNGLTTGATYGDDNNMATNYPIVSLVDTAAGHTFYARTFGFDQMAPLPGHSETTKFTLPTILPNASTGTTYHVHVAANGVVDSGTTQTITVSGTHVTQLTGATSAAPGTSVTWTVFLSAGTFSGTSVALQSSEANVATVPASVFVSAGATSATFQVTSHGFGRATISASVTNGQFKPATKAFGWTVSSVVPGDPNTPFTETVTISNVAPPGGVVVNLSANTTATSLPPTVTVPAGQTQAPPFSITTTQNPSLAVIYASLFNSSQFGYLSADLRWPWLLMLNALTQPTSISNLHVADTANAANWSVQPYLALGATQYGDRTFTLTSIPASLLGANWIRTANGSKLFAGNPTVTFTISQQADVYVAEDTRLPKPSWMGGTWVDSGTRLTNSESPATMFELFKKTFPAGTVSLGPNGGVSASDMYTVIVR